MKKKTDVVQTPFFYRKVNNLQPTRMIPRQQDKVNNANSASIFIINLFIIEGCQSGSVGRGGQVGLVIQVVQVVKVVNELNVVRVARVVRVVQVIKFVRIRNKKDFFIFECVSQ